ncbi:unnamed protein product [Gulo gulo]|uniref:Uncharacterized protein n=1 Tax=Gulo gulo TaxID=48420 RepID=A0A9X9LI84_GULGU|nr:unnamed protein product [Gulo gulo]
MRKQKHVNEVTCRRPQHHRAAGTEFEQGFPSPDWHLWAPVRTTPSRSALTFGSSPGKQVAPGAGGAAPGMTWSPRKGDVNKRRGPPGKRRQWHRHLQKSACWSVGFCRCGEEGDERMG